MKLKMGLGTRNGAGLSATMLSGGGGLLPQTTPTALSAYFWLDPLTTSSLLQNGGAPVDSDGQEVITAKDVVADTLTMTAPAVGQAPLYKTNRQNGKAALYFGGVDEALQTLGLWTMADAGIADGDWCVIAAFKPIALDSNSATVYANDTVWNTTAGYQGIYMKSAPDIRLYNYDGSSDVTTAESVVVGTPIISTSYQTGGNIYHQINNETPQSVASGNNAGGTQTFRVAYSASGAVYTELDLYSLEFYSSKPSDANITLLKNRIINEFAISV